MTTLLDASALVAVERTDRSVVAFLAAERLAGRVALTHGGVVGQVWRSGSGRHAHLARLLAWAQIAALGDGLGRRAGVLLGLTGTSDVIDAALVLLARDGDTILTSDPDDLALLAAATGVDVEILRV